MSLFMNMVKLEAKVKKITELCQSDKALKKEFKKGNNDYGLGRADLASEILKILSP